MKTTYKIGAFVVSKYSNNIGTVVELSQDNTMVKVLWDDGCIDWNESWTLTIL